MKGWVQLGPLLWEGITLRGPSPNWLPLCDRVNCYFRFLFCMTQEFFRRFISYVVLWILFGIIVVVFKLWSCNRCWALALIGICGLELGIWGWVIRTSGTWRCWLHLFPAYFSMYICTREVIGRQWRDFVCLCFSYEPEIFRWCWWLWWSWCSCINTYCSRLSWCVITCHVYKLCVHTYNLILLALRILLSLGLLPSPYLSNHTFSLLFAGSTSSPLPRISPSSSPCSQGSSGINPQSSSLFSLYSPYGTNDQQICVTL